MSECQRLAHYEQRISLLRDRRDGGGNILGTSNLRCQNLQPKGNGCGPNDIGFQPVGEVVALNKTASRRRLGTISCRSSNRLPVRSAFWADSPVRLPPGCAKLATRPEPTARQGGSLMSPPLRSERVRSHT